MERIERKILIIDDDELIGTIIEDILRSRNYLTRRVIRGREGVEITNEWHPDVILLDLVMPEMDGIEACKAIRQLGLPKRPSIVVVSSRGEKTIIAEVLSHGADDYIVKPVDELELLSRIRAQLRIVDFQRELEEDKKNLETILAITKAVGATLDTNEVLNTIVKKVSEVTGAVRCSIILVSDDDGYVLASCDNPYVQNMKLDLRKYPEILKVIDTQTPLAIEDLATHPLLESVRALVNELRDMSVLVVPIVFNEKVLGTLFLRARRPKKSFSEKEVRFCQIVANSSHHAIKNAKIFEELQKEKEHFKSISIIDQMTELYNHNFFYMKLDEEFERAIRYNHDLSLAMVDVDDFKRINDRYGHRAGDATLKAIAAMIKKTIRKMDFVARYGGEEFAVILPDTPTTGAVNWAEKVVKLISEHCYANLIKEEITISLGIISYPSKGIMTAEDMVNSADKALYEAKKAGKNCVRVFA